MECSNCHQTVEAGAAFCGNCGYKLTVTPAGAYALAVPAQQKGETRALLAVLFGAVGLAGSVFMALVGLILGLTGLVLGTLSRRGPRRGLSTAGIILSSLSLLAGLAVWTYAFNQTNNVKTAHSTSGPTITANDLTTPCYSLGFTDRLNISHSGESCDMRAFNGQTIDTSTDAYKVYASQTALSSASSFTELAKNALEKDVKTNLPTFNVTSEHVGAFAGSPDYVVVATDQSSGVTVAEAAVFHQASGGDNVFILVHAITGNSSDFSTLEAQWQWK